MNDATTPNGQLPLDAHLNLETARVQWAEIERLFAGGHVIRVAAELDLITVGVAFAEDHADKVRSWMQAGQVGYLDDETAAAWASPDAPELWGVVIRPWVLVQARP